MRPLPLLLSLLSCVFGFSLLLYYGTARASATTDYEERSKFGTYLTWRAPSSLFPPSAMISLTDDNSTFFLARPAAFGPSLPIKSLSGQLWVGSGFGDDNLGRSSPGGNQEGELGCSDVPGWSNTDPRKAAKARQLLAIRADQPPHMVEEMLAATEGGHGMGLAASTKNVKPDDGTDDHLLAPKTASDHAKSKDNQHNSANIQSLQESAEIAGKIVLLSRGGCGFLDKVKWAQRRGAVAVIVGDDIRGGPLVTMYARGDTSNITISALFTSHTTAHLLSSLIPPDNKTIAAPNDATRLGVAIGDGVKRVKQKNRTKTKAPHSKATALPEDAGSAVLSKDVRAVPAKRASPQADEGPSWAWSIFGLKGANGRPASSHKPPTTGNIDWILQTDFEEKEEASGKKLASSKRPMDGFQIGVHDWRDPDLVAAQKEQRASRSIKEDAAVKVAQPAGIVGAPKDSSSTPRSGEYGKAAGKLDKVNKVGTSSKKPSTKHKSKGWLNRIINGEWDELDPSRPATHPSTPTSNIIEPAQPISNPVHMHDIHIPGAMYDEPTEHEGLWITLTPTSLSSSPFFDTLLVLVVSPLVTLTVVYALLLLRSRIRRRRWRAPKSVVERLPVRTYQTMASNSRTSSTTSSISISTPATANTPLLSTTSARPIRPRPRSRTDSHLQAQSSSAAQSLEQEEEKREAGLSEWRRKYGGKQKECVVCLEEYIDGVSRVMSLPCGHEFHEGCITPWLTTRRRTCPICKGDVVRSLARSQGSSSSMPHDLRDEAEEEVQEQAALLINDDPASQRPISRDDEAFQDLERGMVGHVDRDR